LLAERGGTCGIFVGLLEDGQTLTVGENLSSDPNLPARGQTQTEMEL
jgi:hypothetical protein